MHSANQAHAHHAPQARPANRLWVVVADDAMARILAVSETHGQLEEIETFTDPELLANWANLRHDVFGRPRRGHAFHMDTPANTDPPTQGASFAQVVARRLADACEAQLFDRLKIVAPPQFLAWLHHALDPAVARKVVEGVGKDFTHLSTRSLAHRLLCPSVPNKG
jgi:protein required for attachment to host cells